MSRREHLREVLETALEEREASAVVHVAPEADPAMRYCLSAIGSADASERGPRAVAFTPEGVLECGPAGGGHPAATLAERLDAALDGPDRVLTPRTIPHDAALFLERAGFEVASSDALDRARVAKTGDERERIAAAQAAAAAGVRRGAALLADATVDADRLVADGEAVTPTRLRRAIDAAVVAAGAFPAGNTVVNPDFECSPSEHEGVGAGGEPLRAGEPIVLSVAPRGPDGYHGSLVRTVVVDGEGGPERRAHVAATHAFRSARALCASDEPTVEAVAGDLAAEIRAFGFDEGIETAVHGVGLETRERPGPGDAVGAGSICVLSAAVVVDGRRVAIADLIERTEDGPRWLAAPSRSLEPSALLE